MPVGALLCESTKSAGKKQKNRKIELSLVEVDTLPAYRGRQIMERVVQELFVEITLLNISFITKNSSALPEALRVVTPSSLNSSKDVLLYQRKRILEINKDLPIAKIYRKNENSEEEAHWKSIIEAVNENRPLEWAYRSSTTPENFSLHEWYFRPLGPC